MRLLTVLLVLFLGNCLAKDSYLDALKKGRAVSYTPRKTSTKQSESHLTTSEKTTKKNTPSPTCAYKALYSSPPRGSKPHLVRNVYDGDTLTLLNGKRVRLLGIDTPELAPKQPFAEEAKAFVKSRCHQKEIYVDSAGSDRYGRLLAYIYVKEGGKFLNINEALIAEGLANVYTVGDAVNQKLIGLQKNARKNRKGVWSTFNHKEIVYKTKNGRAFHRSGCTHLKPHWKLTPIRADLAIDRGFHPCRACME